MRHQLTFLSVGYDKTSGFKKLPILEFAILRCPYASWLFSDRKIVEC